MMTKRMQRKSGTHRLHEVTVKPRASRTLREHAQHRSIINHAPHVVASDHIQSSVEHINEALLPSFQHFGHVLAQSVHDPSRVEAILGAVAHVFRANENPSRQSFTQAEADYLITSGAFTAEQLADTETRVADGAVVQQEATTLGRALAHTRSTAEVAQRFGITESAVRQRHRQGKLFGFKIGRTRLYPTWQFADVPGGVLPGIPEIAAAMPASWTAVPAEGFMTNPKSELDGESPVEWLRTGGDPAAVAALLDARSRA